MSMLWVLLGFVLFGIAFILIVVRRGLELRRLVEGGVATRGTIEKKWKHTGSGGRSTKRLRYKFMDNEGNTRSRAIIASQSEYDSLEEGDPVTVVYLPGKSGVNALETLVEQARQGLESKRKAGA